MHGKLELMHPVFQVIIFRIVIWWLSMFILLGGM